MNEKSSSLLVAILVEPNIRAQLEELLNGTGFTLQFADSADIGLQIAAELFPAAVLLDLDPTLSPYETCRRLRADRLLGKLPVLMLSDRASRDARAAGLSAGADDFIEKPFDGIELLARLRTITRLNSYRLLLDDLTRFSWMVEHAQEGYLMLDQALSIHYANERAQSLLNLPQDYLGLPFLNIVERLYLPEPEETWKNWPNDPEPCFLVQPESPTARTAWIVLEALDTPLGVDYHRIVRLRDVTERMSIYQDMRRFHTVVAHKLRTPMSIMCSNLWMLKNRLDMLSPEEIRQMTNSSIEGAERLANEIRRILTYIDAPLALNLGTAVKLEALPEMVSTICAAIQLNDVVLSLPNDLLSTSLALTPEALEMILHELLENARKFHPTHTPQVEISVGQPEAGFINLRVADNGLTLTPEQLAWAWLPYMQGEKDFTGEVPGIGLGFPMVATLVWKAGGDLSLRNRPDGPGVVVEMKIPLESTSRQLERTARPFERP